MLAAGLSPAIRPMTSRYFIETPVSESWVTLSGAEAHHLSHVMRASPGDRITLFDGSGAEFTAEVERIERREAQLTIVERVEVDRELPLRITLAVALPKGDRQKWLVEKAVELGVAELVPLLTERSIADPKPQALARLERAVIEASKQCGRNRLMQIEQPRGWSDFVAETADVACRLLAHPGGCGELRACDLSSELRRAVLAVGPEGGFSDAEITSAVESGWRKIGLGRRILRIETAALLLAGIVSSPFFK